jgi:hypothetical protein
MVRLPGLPLTLHSYPSETLTNRQFARQDLSRLDTFFLPDSLKDLIDVPPQESMAFIEDDNRGAILPEPVSTLDGQAFYLSVKGIGSTVDPFSWRVLDRIYASELVEDGQLRSRLRSSSTNGSDRLITGELWLRGSPYGGQGLEHAAIALAISERADLTSINGFRIAPVVKIAFLPPSLQEELRQIHWYRKYRGRMVQELRLVPSNVRVYFHAKNTIGNTIGQVFDLFSIDTGGKAHRFVTNFLRSGVAMLTLFSRTLRFDPGRGRYLGLDFHDVWLDKDAVVAPDGTVFFVDLEGIEEVSVDADGVPEKVEDQVYRSLYELMFAYEQIDHERQRRFGGEGSRKRRFEAALEEALSEDPFVRLDRQDRRLEMVIRNECEGGPVYVRFTLVDE